MRRILYLLLAMTMVAVSAGPAGAKTQDSADLHDFADDTLIGGGAHTTLRRAADDVSLSVHSRSLNPGHAYTVWLVIFNDPETCVGGCGEDDLDNGTGNPSVMFGGAAGIANRAGNLNMMGGITEDNREGYQLLLSDLGVEDDPGFLDAEGAEIHAIIRDHGPSTGHAHQVETYEGDCTSASSFELPSVHELYTCEDVQFSVHQP